MQAPAAIVRLALATDILRDKGSLTVQVVLGDGFATRRGANLGHAANAIKEVPSEPSNLAEEGATEAGVGDKQPGEACRRPTRRQRRRRCSSARRGMHVAGQSVDALDAVLGPCTAQHGATDGRQLQTAEQNRGLHHGGNGFPADSVDLRETAGADPGNDLRDAHRATSFVTRQLERGHLSVRVATPTSQVISLPENFVGRS